MHHQEDFFGNDLITCNLRLQKISVEVFVNVKAFSVSMIALSSVMFLLAAKCDKNTNVPDQTSQDATSDKNVDTNPKPNPNDQQLKREALASEALFKAIKERSAEGVDKAIADGALLNSKNAEGDTPLIASIKESVKQVPSPVPCKLAADKASINQKDKDGKSALQIAFERGLAPEIFCLIENGADRSEPIFKGMTPWDWAIKNDRMKLAEALVKAGEAKRKELIEGVSPLVWAIIKQKSALAMAMLENGADPNYGGDNDEEPIFFALAEKNFDVADKLVSLPQTNLNALDQNLDSPLHRAVNLSRAVLVEDILMRHVNPNLKNNKGKTPLHLAYEAKQWSIAQRLLENGANLSIKDASGKTADSYGYNWLRWNPAKIVFGPRDSDSAKKTVCMNHLRTVIPGLTPDRAGAKLLLKESATVHPDRCQKQDEKNCAEIFSKLTECRIVMR